MSIHTVSQHRSVIASAPRRPVPEADRTHRRDVQGLRALAVGMVVAFHLYPGHFTGGFAGVDVFFVISGFLITGHLFAVYRRSGRIRLLEFWGRRARRLLPAAALVLVVTWTAAKNILPATRLPATAEQIRASALYFQNWTLAGSATNYLTADDTPTPVQHFWSLSVEEQFYLVWPFLFVLVAVVTIRSRRRVGHAMALGLAASVVAASLVWSLHLTRTDPAAAYYVTTTRMWELAAGGVLALLPRRMASAIGRAGWAGWVGLALVGAATFLITSSTPYPGAAALLPVVGAVLLIACGSRDAAAGPAPLTSLAPLVFIGDISYSIYLWHWPLIVLWKDYSEGDIGYLDGPAIVVVSILLAWATKALVEDRVRLSPVITRRPVLSLATAAVLAVPVGLVALYSPPPPWHGHADASHPGAAVLAGAAEHVPSVAYIPPAIAAAADRPAHEAYCEVAQTSTDDRACTLGDTSHPTKTVAVVGDSVAGQWLTAVVDIAETHHWKVVTYLHSLCPWTATTTALLGSSQANAPCHTWDQRVQHDLLSKLKPDVVITSERPVLGTPDHPTAGPASFAEIARGMVTYWEQLHSIGTRVVAIHESPEMGRDIPDCLSAPGGSPSGCSLATSKALTPGPPVPTAVRAAGSFASMIDLNSLICGPSVCEPVVGNVEIYRDKHHLTTTYTQTLEPYLERRLLATGAFGPTGRQ